MVRSYSRVHVLLLSAFLLFVWFVYWSASTNLYEMYPLPYWNVHQQLCSVISLWIYIWLQAKWLKARQHDFQEGKFWVLGFSFHIFLFLSFGSVDPSQSFLVSSLCLCLAALFWFPEPAGIWKWFFFWKSKLPLNFNLLEILLLHELYGKKNLSK